MILAVAAIGLLLFWGRINDLKGGKTMAFTTTLRKFAGLAMEQKMGISSHSTYGTRLIAMYVNRGNLYSSP
jgi:hypothetical protein